MEPNNKDIQILIVDDEPGIRSMLTFELGVRGLKTMAAEDGLKGLEMLRGQKIALVITDLKMPKMDGIALLREIKKVAPAIQVIVVTGFGTIEAEVVAMKEGAFGFIRKPFHLDEFCALVDRALRKSAVGPAES